MSRSGEKSGVKHLRHVKHFYNTQRDEIMLVHYPYDMPEHSAKFEAVDATFDAVAAVTAWALKTALNEMPVLTTLRAKVSGYLHRHFGARSLRARAVRETLIGDDIVRVTVEVLRPSDKEWTTIQSAREEVELG